VVTDELTVNFTCIGQIANLANNTTVICTSQVNKEIVTYSWEFQPADSDLVSYTTNSISVSTVPRGNVRVKLTVTSGSESKTIEQTNKCYLWIWLYLG
jgi:hypothetical protein